MENKPNTLQEALQIIEAANVKINEISAQRDSFEAENIKLKKTSEESSAEIFALKSSVETEQKTSAVLKQKLEATEAKNAELQTKLGASENAKSQTEIRQPLKKGYGRRNPRIGKGCANHGGIRHRKARRKRLRARRTLHGGNRPNAIQSRRTCEGGAHGKIRRQNFRIP